VTIELGKIPGLGEKVLSMLSMSVLKVPVTQAVIYGWYDNEMGSYVNILGDRTVSVAENI
jgi:glyceraldehyde 3-phosphate dehydrogenase